MYSDIKEVNMIIDYENGKGLNSLTKTQLITFAKEVMKEKEDLVSALEYSNMQLKSHQSRELKLKEVINRVENIVQLLSDNMSNTHGTPKTKSYVKGSPDSDIDYSYVYNQKTGSITKT